MQKNQLVQSVEFPSLVLHEILRSILNRILLVEQVRVPDDSDEGTTRWLKFAESMPGVGTVPDVADPECDIDWIDSAIGSFCRWRSVDRQFAGFWNTKSLPEESV